MNETQRTGTYVAVAVILGLFAWWASPSVEITPQELQAAKIGTPFYEKFNPNEATSIRVAGFDDAKAESKTFAVSFKDGKWTIPSHHNYPADGADRLADTATSFNDVKREELAVGGDSEQSHEKLGVVDPLDESKADLKGHGQRITINKGEDTLVDLIIGKQVKDRPGYYYVRMPRENSTYVAKLALNLSTKFSDWIETDLLKLNRDDVREIALDNSSIDEVRGRLIEGQVETLAREKSADPWKLEGLDEAKEELDTAKINTLLSTLDDLRLVGVRPRPKGLRPDLTLDPEFIKYQDEYEFLKRDLLTRGYVLIPDKNRDFHLFSNEGELSAATNKGVVYMLKFGEVFTGDESEIEVGGNKDDEKKADDKKPRGDKKDADKKGGDKKGGDKDKTEPGKQPSRYLFVTARFDEKYLGPAPVEPARPEGLPADESDSEKKPKIKAQKSEKKPKAPAPESDGESESSQSPKTPADGDDPPAASPKGDDQCGPPAADDPQAEAPARGATTPDADDPQDDDPGKDQTVSKKDGPDEDAPNEDGAKDKQEPAASDAKPAPEKVEQKPEDVKKEYDDKVKKYKSDLKAYEDKIDAGKKLVDELNDRFNDWYYVISAESFNKLHLERKDLVKEKGKPAGDDKSKDKPADKDPFTPDSKDEPDSGDEADAPKDSKAKSGDDAKEPDPKKSDASKSEDDPEN